MKEQILLLRQEGKSLNEIASILDCSKSTVAYHASSQTQYKTKERRQKSRKLFRIELKALHGGKCSICGYNKCLDALHFHHTNPSNKLGLVTKLFYEKNKLAAEEEAKKCILICANCHAELHAQVS